MSTGTAIQSTLKLDAFDMQAAIIKLSPDGQARVQRVIQEVRAREDADRHKMRHIMAILRSPKTTTALLRCLNNCQGCMRYTLNKVECLLAALEKQDFIRRDPGGRWHKRRDL